MSFWSLFSCFSSGPSPEVVQPLDPSSGRLDLRSRAPGWVKRPNSESPKESASDIFPGKVASDLSFRATFLRRTYSLETTPPEPNVIAQST
ncbi:hypothetical protein FKP32DRAFT_1597189 [Trametes sanguinea]|nr:hypothetical protein FKP32DRAFT_1597189 [Trametes sanguinea]